MEKLICAHCGKEKVTFWIGASPDPDMDDPAEGWIKHKATGEITCPECAKKGVI